jgi:hypothetical protein
MALPKIEHPIYEVYLKSLDKKVRYRPFLVKEEKLLLMAKESDDVQDILKTIKQIIGNCCLDNIDVESLPIFDVEMFFIHLRVNSVGETAELVYTCSNVVDENSCGNVVEFNLELKNVKYRFNDDHKNIIPLTNEIGVCMRYPSLNLPQSILDDKFTDGGYEIISEFLEYVYDAEQKYSIDQVSKEELLAFLDDLSLEQVKSIKNFFATTPSVVLEQDVKCSKCGNINHMVLEGILNFFE